MPRRLPLTILMVLAVALSASAEALSDADLRRHIDSPSDFNHAARMTVARMIRRAPAASVVPALAASARAHPDEFVRDRALVLLTSFNDGGTAALMRTLLADRNDRAQRAMLGEIGRGFDVFRSVVVSALRDYRATYAVDAVSALTGSEGALQDDAVLALRRIGDRRALGTLAELAQMSTNVMAAVQAAQRPLGDSCGSRIGWLEEAARNPLTRPDGVRAALGALAAIGETQAAARETLVRSATGAPDRRRRVAGLAFSSLALRQRAQVIAWLGDASDEVRAQGIELLGEGFQNLEDDFAEEQFFGAARAAYWQAADASPGRTIAATQIDRREF